jgi:phenylalanyl-tRNA synthetase alpha chain
MDGVRLFPTRDLESQGHSTPADQNRFVEMDMKRALEGMVQQIFGKVQIRWVDAYFPFTDPSWEMEIFFDNNWLEVLGCGLIQHDILKGCGLRGKEKDKEKENIGWAFGLGLERLAMVLFDIPDIRLFWSEDRRFVDQFKSGKSN